MQTMESQAAQIVPAAALVADSGSAIEAPSSECASMNVATALRADCAPTASLANAGGSSHPGAPDASALPDEELGMADPPPAVEKPAPSRTSRRTRVLRCCLLAGVAFGILIFFRPRKADWRMSSLNIDVAKFGQVMMGGANSTEPLSFNAGVQFYNPNWIGARMEPGRFRVTFGGAVLAEGTTPEGKVGSRSSSDMSVAVTMKLDDGMSKNIMDELLANEFKLRVVAEAEVPAKVLFINLRVRVRCEILSDAIQVTKGPEGVIVDKSCTYALM